MGQMSKSLPELDDNYCVFRQISVFTNYCFRYLSICFQQLSVAFGRFWQLSVAFCIYLVRATQTARAETGMVSVLALLMDYSSRNVRLLFPSPSNDYNQIIDIRFSKTAQISTVFTTNKNHQTTISKNVREKNDRPIYWDSPANMNVNLKRPITMQNFTETREPFFLGLNENGV